MGGETANIAEIASVISREIFRNFGWSLRPARDQNFPCNDKNHCGSGKSGKSKIQHPADAVFFYEDPYLGKQIYLHTDLKSYAKTSITNTSLRKAFVSLAMTVECAQSSDVWRERYLTDPDERHEVRGLLFVHNHDQGYGASFQDALSKMNVNNIPVARDSVLHFLGPQDIQRLYTITNDMARLRDNGELDRNCTFYYPDLVMRRRHGDGWNQAATIESLTGPYLIIKHKSCENAGEGYIIYYNREGDSVEEFEYFLDSLSRFQMLERDQVIRVRVTNSANQDLKSVFDQAKHRYAKAWGFLRDRQEIVENISISRVTSVVATYNPGEIGWRP